MTTQRTDPTGASTRALAPTEWTRSHCLPTRAAAFGQVAVDPSGRIVVDTQVNSQDVLTGIVGDPVVAFGDASSVSTSSGTPTAVYDVSETAGTATITLTRGGDLSQALSVPFSTDDSGGHAGRELHAREHHRHVRGGLGHGHRRHPDPGSIRTPRPLSISRCASARQSGGAVLGSVSVGDLHIVPVEGIVIAPRRFRA